MKRLFTVILWMLILTAAMVGCKSTSSTSSSNDSNADTLVMRLAHINPNSDPKQKEAEKFAELVTKKTNGKVKIEIYGGAVLGNTRELIEGLQLGTNEIVIEGFGTLNSYTKLAYLDNVPFLFRDYNHFMKAWEGEVGNQILNDAGSEAGMKLFAPSYRGTRIVTSTKKFTNVRELRGLKIRVPNDDMSVKTWQELETNPTPMDMTEVLTGIQQGTVEAQENPSILSYSYGLYDVCDYLIRTNHRNSADIFMMNNEYFNKLSTDVQQALIESAKEAASYISGFILDNEEAYLKKWEDKDVEIVAPEIDGFIQKTEGLIEKNFSYLTNYVNKIKNVQ